VALFDGFILTGAGTALDARMDPEICPAFTRGVPGAAR
jgi:hypothetical protein